MSFIKRKRLHSEMDEHGIPKRFKVSETKEIERENVKELIEKSREDAFPLREDGSTLHLNIKAGQVANRVFSVGDTKRCVKLSRFFDKPESCIQVISTRTFRVFTGTFRGVPVSLVATGMGVPMMDFVVREIRNVVKGPLAMMRFGTCGVIHPELEAGNVIVAKKGAVFIQSNHEEMIKGNESKSYRISKPVLPDEKLAKKMMENIQEIIGKETVRAGMNCSADSFYGSEGRYDPNFRDHNDHLIDNLREKYPETASLEMETFTLLHLGKLSTEPMH